MAYGIDKNWIIDSLYGIALAIAFILLSFISPFIGTIGIPSVSASLVGEAGKFIIIVLLAPIFEEILFRDFVLDFFDSKLKLGYLISALISSIIFSLFHLSAYGGNLSAMGGSFISVFLVGMSFAYIRKFTKSNIGNIFAHAIINFYILSKLAVVIG